MKATAQFDQAKHNVALDHDCCLMAVRYVPYAEHVKRFHMTMRGRFSQMHHVVGTERSCDPIMSDA
jgi:hypothetical protein